MSAKELAGMMLLPAIKSDSRRDYGSARVILGALGVWVFSLAVSLFAALLIRP